VDAAALLHPLAAAPGGRAARDVVAALGLREGPLPAGRARVVAVMVASADGRAAVQGRSVALGHPADRALFRELRTHADALLVGTGTLAAERYKTVVDEEQAGHRVRLGRPAKPLVATIARGLDVPDGIGLFAEPDQAVAVYTDAEGEAPSHGAAVSTHRVSAPRDVLAHLRSEHGARLVMCEGGPRLLAALAAEDLVDDLVLTIAPLLAAGDEPAALAGPALDPPARLRLRDAFRAEDHLFLHYAAR
jgi:riboflavin biosynthesis pyrimidine reductase